MILTESLKAQLFVITACNSEDGCEIFSEDEARCLRPETMAEHVLGMAHLVVSRNYLSAAEQDPVDILTEGGGQVLMIGADYDYVSLNVSHFPMVASGSSSSEVMEDADKVPADEGRKPLNADAPSQTKETSIARLDERLHEIVAQINRAKNLENGDFVLVLPSALDFTLNRGDYLIVGLDGVPPPLRSHYRVLERSDP